MYKNHLQGIEVDGLGHVYWSFTDVLVKTDLTGAILERVQVPFHHGDLVFRDRELFVATNLGKDSAPTGADSWVYIYDANSLALKNRIPLPDVIFGAGGIASHGSQFLVVGGLPSDETANVVYEYGPSFELSRAITIPGYTQLGVQTATFGDGHWWLGCYGGTLLRVHPSYADIARFRFDAALGLAALSEGRYYVGRGQCGQEGCIGTAVLVPLSTILRTE
ncbi:MAG: hypothetical protein ACE148_17230 [Vicinamibacterales bacterium]